MNIVLCGNYGVTNIGDEAIREGLTSSFRKIIPDANIKVMGRGNLLPLGLRSFIRALFHPELWRKPISSIKNSDIFVLGGGGLFTDEEGEFVSLFWALHGICAILLKRPLFVLGVSVGPVYFWNRPFVAYVLRRAKLIFVRDSASKNLLKKWGVNSYKTTDIATFTNHVTTSNDISDKYVVASFRNADFLNEDLHKKIAQACDELIMNFGLRIIFLPFNDRGVADTYILNKIFMHMKNRESAIIRKFSGNLDEIVSIFSGAKFAFGMRLHAGILSVFSGTPFIPFVYMKKVSDYWREFGLPTFDIFNWEISDFIGLCGEYVKNEKSSIQAVMKHRQDCIHGQSLFEQQLGNVIKTLT